MGLGYNRFLLVLVGLIAVGPFSGARVRAQSLESEREALIAFYHATDGDHWVQHYAPFDTAGLTSGVYVYTFTANGRTETRKMVVAR